MLASQTIFVYGTLKRGQCREACWPRSPQSVRPAFVRGKLLCLGPFPGLIEGDGWVRGEAWTVTPEDLTETLRVLDVIEGYQQPGEPNQYDRVEVELFARINDTASQNAITYRLADPRLRRSGKTVRPSTDASGFPYAEWSAVDG